LQSLFALLTHGQELFDALPVFYHFYPNNALKAIYNHILFLFFTKKLQKVGQRFAHKILLNFFYKKDTF